MKDWTGSAGSLTGVSTTDWLECFNLGTELAFRIFVVEELLMELHFLWRAIIILEVERC